MARYINSPIDSFVDLIRENQRPNMRVCEVGCFDGSTTREAIIPVIENNGQYIVIDWFKGTMHPGWEHGGEHAYKPDKDVFDWFWSNMKEAGVTDNLVAIRKKSEEGSLEIKDDSLDICFIDADHSYLGVKKDIELFLPKIKSGGILCGHDYDDVNHVLVDNTYTDDQLSQDTIDTPLGPYHMGTIKAVYEKFGKLEIRRNRNNVAPIWIYRKP